MKHMRRKSAPGPPVLGQKSCDDTAVTKLTLTIIERNTDIERGLYQCTEGGFTLREVPPGIHAPEAAN